jgi:hypothetical protein
VEDFSTFTTEGLRERRQRLIDTRPNGTSPDFKTWVEMHEDTIQNIDLELAKRREAALDRRQKTAALVLYVLFLAEAWVLAQWLHTLVAFAIAVLTAVLFGRLRIDYWIARFWPASDKR